MFVVRVTYFLIITRVLIKNHIKIRWFDDDDDDDAVTELNCAPDNGRFYFLPTSVCDTKNNDLPI